MASGPVDDSVVARSPIRIRKKKSQKSHRPDEDDGPWARTSTGVDLVDSVDTKGIRDLPPSVSNPCRCLHALRLYNIIGPHTDEQFLTCYLPMLYSLEVTKAIVSFSYIPSLCCTAHCILLIGILQDPRQLLSSCSWRCCTQLCCGAAGRNVCYTWHAMHSVDPYVNLSSCETEGWKDRKEILCRSVEAGFEITYPQTHKGTCFRASA